jgi:alcohol dehydrogenase class IV
MSRPIGGLFHVPHGMSNAMLLPAITEWSISGAPSRYADCARAMQLANASDSDDQANQKLVAGLRQLCADLQVPTPASFGISEEQWRQAIPTMAQQALDSGSPANNPRIPNAEQIAELYQGVWTN